MRGQLATRSSTIKIEIIVTIQLEKKQRNDCKETYQQMIRNSYNDPTNVLPRILKKPWQVPQVECPQLK